MGKEIESEQPPQQEKDMDIPDEEGEEIFDFSADFDGVFGLKERDESGSMSDEEIPTASPLSRKDVSPSPRSVVSPKVYDGNLAEKEQQQPQEDEVGVDDDAPLTSLNKYTTRKPISLEGYTIGDEAKKTDFAPDTSKKDAALEAKSLEVLDAAFILRSDGKWTYAVVSEKTVDPNGKGSLRFEVEADSSKTFIEARWGKYVRVVKTENSIVKEGATAAVVANDPDLLIYESDSDEEILNDDDEPNENVPEDAKDRANDECDEPNDQPAESGNADDDAADVTNVARPKGILRKKEENSPDKDLKPNVDKSIRSSVQFAQLNTNDDLESNAADDSKQVTGNDVESKAADDSKQVTGHKVEPKAADDSKQVTGNELESKAAEDSKQVTGSEVESKAADDSKQVTGSEVESKAADDSKQVTGSEAESKAADDSKQTTGTGQDEKEDSIFEEVEEKDMPKPEPVEFFPAKEITFPTPIENETAEVRTEHPEVDDEMSVVSQDKNVFSEAEDSDQTAPSKDGKEDVMQTPTSCKEGPELFGCSLSPVQLDMGALTPSKIGESWNVGQILLNLAQPFTQPVFNWPSKEDDDSKNSEASTVVKDSDLPVEDVVEESHTVDGSKDSEASTPVKDTDLPVEDVVEESLTIECELQNADDIKVHEIHMTSLPLAATQAESKDENKSSDKTNDVGTTSLPASDAIQSANELSLLKRDALNIHKRKGVVPKTMRSIPSVTKRERSLKLVANTISKVRSSKKAEKGGKVKLGKAEKVGKVNLDAMNVTADTIDSYEVHLE